MKRKTHKVKEEEMKTDEKWLRNDYGITFVGHLRWFDDTWTSECVCGQFKIYSIIKIIFLINGYLFKLNWIARYATCRCVQSKATDCCLLLFCNVFGAAIEVIGIENGQHGNDTYCRLCNFDETQTITARIYAKEEKETILIQLQQKKNVSGEYWLRFSAEYQVRH